MWKRRRSTDKRYPGDNRLIFPKSPYRRDGLAPRCRLVASWGRSRSQGLGCSPIKAARELGLERRETVRSLSAARVRNLRRDRKSTRLNSSHLVISYAVFCLKKKNEQLQCTNAHRRLR